MQRHYDVLITSASWESRSAAILQHINEFSFTQAYVFRYTHKRPKAAEVAEQQYHDLLAHQLRKKCTGEVYSLPGRLWEPLSGLRSVVQNIRRTLGSESGLRIFFDVSTFSKAYVLVFLRYFDDSLLRNKLTLFYTDLVQPQRGKPSEGVREVITLPFYGGAFSSGKETLLMTFVASEPERVTALWEHISPQVTVPLFSYRRDLHNPLTSQILRDQFLSRAGVREPIEVDGSSPLNVAGALAEVHGRYRDGYNVVVGAVGTKLQAVGIYIFTKLQSVNPDVFYPVASRYNPEYWNPTRIGRSMLIEIASVYSVKYLDPEPELVAC
jgi:hypothetical protein